MRRSLPVLFFIFITVVSLAQNNMRITGHVEDTTSGAGPLPDVVAMVIRLNDSILVDYTRTNDQGIFDLQQLPLDTYQVILSHPKFAEQTFIIIGNQQNHEFGLGRIVLPPKSHTLNEVVVYAFKDPVYYKGDTLVYTADSFKVKPNATVEDLLKKLPGVKVDSDGKITSQGKKVDKVLVDGDEFFGSDPTVATKNLNAASVESVQVYDKKNDNATSDNGTDETIKVMDLKLKDAAKKGYFGKASGATDFNHFYEGEVLANHFKDKQKISVFGQTANTPNSGFSWSDISKYGLDNEYDSYTSDDGVTYMTNDGGANSGIPRTLKTGFYFTDRLSKNTKLGFNYTYTNNELTAKRSTRSQYFLQDTTYTTNNTSENVQKSEAHMLNVNLEQKIDSLTDLQIKPKLVLSDVNTRHQEFNDFLTSDNLLTRQTNIDNSSEAKALNISGNAKLTRRFKKKDRLLLVNYNLTTNNNTSNGQLNTDNIFYTPPPSTYTGDVDQKKENESHSQNHTFSTTYTEPLNKKIKLELSYDFFYNQGRQDKSAFNNVNGEYSQRDSIFSNNFRNQRITNRAGLKFIYEVKKQRLAFGSRVRQVSIRNENVVKQQTVTQLVNNVLPFLTYRYKFNDNCVVEFQYYTASDQPTITQLQPIPDNTNPNYIKVGNPNLLPTYQHHFNIYYYDYKPISGKSTWAGIFSTVTDNAFSNSTIYDSIGRTFSQAINVDGNINANGYVGTSYPLFKKVLFLEPNINAGFNRDISYINNQRNDTRNLYLNGSFDVKVEKEKYTLSLGANIGYNHPESSLNTNSNKPYTTQRFTFDGRVELPKKFVFSSNLTYNLNNNLTQGYNINYLIWNASLEKIFLKNENLIVAINAKDLLNQNISTYRDVQANVITDTKTNIISRYVLLRVTYKFNSTHTKDSDEDY